MASTVTSVYLEVTGIHDRSAIPREADRRDLKRKIAELLRSEESVTSIVRAALISNITNINAPE
jgi:hypothetical protein